MVSLCLSMTCTGRGCGMHPPSPPADDWTAVRGGHLASCSGCAPPPPSPPVGSSLFSVGASCDPLPRAVVPPWCGGAIPLCRSSSSPDPPSWCGGANPLCWSSSSPDPPPCAATVHSCFPRCAPLSRNNLVGFLFEGIQVSASLSAMSIQCSLP